MYRIPGVVSTATTARAPAEAIAGQAGDREPTALDLSDLAVRWLHAARQDLQAALRLMGDHPASGKIRHAVDEMDHAVRDIRDAASRAPAG
jgi:hypothetical protein